MLSNTMSKAVVTVISELLDNKGSCNERDNHSVYAIKALIYKKVGIQTLPLHLEPQKILT